MQHSVRATSRRRNPTDKASIDRGLASVPRAVATAARAAEQALAQGSVRHLFCGGIAVAAWGYERSTRDVDFLVGDEGFNKRGILVFPRADIPVEVDGVLVDLVTLPSVQALVEHELNTNTTGVVSFPFLVLMKLIAYRGKDKQDVIELLRLDADRADSVRNAFTLDAQLKKRLLDCEADSQS